MSSSNIYTLTSNIPNFHLLSRGQQLEQKWEPPLVVVQLHRAASLGRLIDTCLLLNALSSRVWFETEQNLMVSTQPPLSLHFSGTRSFMHTVLRCRNMFTVSMGTNKHNSPHVGNPVCNHFSEHYWPVWCWTDTLHNHTVHSSRSLFTLKKPNTKKKKKKKRFPGMVFLEKKPLVWCETCLLLNRFDTKLKILV